jgi:hypothetical protein
MKNTTVNPNLQQTNVNGLSFSFFVGGTEIMLENKGESKGEIKIIDPERGTYTYFWGSMGSDIQGFMVRINGHYFLDKLLGHRASQVFDVKKTFKELRRFIRYELDLPWYKHLDFQKDLREKLSNFQTNCEEINSDRYFVDSFDFNVGTMPDFYLIEDRWERERIQRDFNNISEPWYFIQTKLSEEAKWLKLLHSKIKKKIQSKSVLT